VILHMTELDMVLRCILRIFALLQGLDPQFRYQVPQPRYMPQRFSIYRPRQRTKLFLVLSWK
jgi:hypothetical protein